MKNLELNKYFSAILLGDCHDQRSLWSDSATWTNVFRSDQTLRTHRSAAVYSGEPARATEKSCQEQKGYSSENVSVDVEDNLWWLYFCFKLFFTFVSNSFSPIWLRMKELIEIIVKFLKHAKRWHWKIDASLADITKTKNKFSFSRCMYFNVLSISLFS